MSTAKFIRKLSGFTGDARLYRLDPPVKYGHDEDDEIVRTAEYVVVSATVAMFQGPETYIFPSDETGSILDWSELDGSYKGGMDHREALSYAGYEIEEPA